MASTTVLPLDVLTLDADIQPRATMSRKLIREYAKLYRDGVPLPPITVFQEGQQYWVADGFHRGRAARQAGLSEIQAHVDVGTKRDAMLYACGANTHGMARTPEDKRRAVGRLLSDGEWQHWSDHEIARHCGVSHEFVRKLRRSLSTGDSEPEKKRTYRTKHGTIATMDTSRIGRTSMAATTPELEPTTALDDPEEKVVWPDVPTTSAPVPDQRATDADEGDERHSQVLDTGEVPRTVIEAAFPSMTVAQEDALGVPRQSKMPTSQRTLSDVLSLMGELCRALRQQHALVPSTLPESWSLELAVEYVRNCAELIEQLQMLRQSLEHYDLTAEQSLMGNERPPDNPGLDRNARHDDTPKSHVSTAVVIQTTSPRAVNKIEDANPGVTDESGADQLQRDRPETVRERARALQAAGLPPEEIVARLNADGGGRRWNRGAVLALLRAEAS